MHDVNSPFTLFLQIPLAKVQWFFKKTELALSMPLWAPSSPCSSTLVWFTHRISDCMLSNEIIESNLTSIIDVQSIHGMTSQLLWGSTLYCQFYLEITTIRFLDDKALSFRFPFDPTLVELLCRWKLQLHNPASAYQKNELQISSSSQTTVMVGQINNLGYPIHYSFPLLHHRTVLAAYMKIVPILCIILRSQNITVCLAENGIMKHVLPALCPSPQCFAVFSHLQAIQPFANFSWFRLLMVECLVL